MAVQDVSVTIRVMPNEPPRSAPAPAFSPLSADRPPVAASRQKALAAALLGLVSAVLIVGGLFELTVAAGWFTFVDAGFNLLLAAFLTMGGIRALRRDRVPALRETLGWTVGLLTVRALLLFAFFGQALFWAAILDLALIAALLAYLWLSRPSRR